VKGAPVVPYYKDLDSEDDENSENESEEGDNKVAMGEEAMTTRWAIMLELQYTFDATKNIKRGDCRWQKSTKTKTAANEHLNSRFCEEDEDQEGEED
jgi:hypothetical protein